MAEDISNKTIVVLVVLTVIISVLGTIVVLAEVQQFEAGMQPNVVGKSTSTAQVSLEVLPREEKPMSSTTGAVVLEILPNK